MKLSNADVEKLMKYPSTKARQEVLSKITEQYNVLDEGSLTGDEAKIVEDIFRVLAKSAEVEIRKSLAESVKNSATLPRDIALTMAKDISEVAIPMLQSSQVLNDDDLLEIINSTQDTERVIAVAKRENLSEKMTTNLLDKGNEEITKTVLGSYGSNISNASYQKLMDGPEVSEQIVHAMVEKGSLSVTLTEKLLKRVTGKIRESLDEKYQIIFESKQMKAEMEKNLQAAAEKMMGVRSNDARNRKLMDELQVKGKLGPFTALSMGNYQMFEVTISRLAYVPLNNVRILLYDHGSVGFKKLYEKAKMPEDLFNLVSLGVRALQTLDAEAPKPVLTHKPKDMVERMKMLAGNQEIAYMDFFISLIKS
jgi:uncharacterized protein (DUF2336 family)